jgi:hypothetical protein
MIDTTLIPPAVLERATYNCAYDFATQDDDHQSEHVRSAQEELYPDRTAALELAHAEHVQRGFATAPAVDADDPRLLPLWLRMHRFTLQAGYPDHWQNLCRAIDGLPTWETLTVLATVRDYIAVPDAFAGDESELWPLLLRMSDHADEGGWCRVYDELSRATGVPDRATLRELTGTTREQDYTVWVDVTYSQRVAVNVRATDSDEAERFVDRDAVYDAISNAYEGPDVDDWSVDFAELND